MTAYLRDSPAEFEALRDSAAERLGVDRGAVEKDYWATEVLRSACSMDVSGDGVVFKGGTSLSKAFGLIERFSEDVDLLVVTTATGNALKRALRGVADRVSADLGIECDREREGRGYLNARFDYPTASPASYLTSGVLLEMGSRGGPAPNEIRAVGSLMSEAAAVIDPTAERDFADLTRFDVTVLAPERTLAEKLAFLHHRASVGDLDSLRRGARHLYDVALVLRSERVRDALADGEMAALMVDVDARSEAAGWPYTPRPDAGFAASPVFAPTSALHGALEAGFADLRELVWGELPTVSDAIEAVRAHAKLL
ncbi:MAG: nucleotidyl transferase AbiEii/AbiGii toxin family protein [Acidimicrobiales bacterium]|nr:nucleotidyl transferase AbiEii/AbiGii toxin family protein [Acidimicrobiales bacterium]